MKPAQVGIVTKTGHVGAARLGRQMAGWLKDRNVPCTVAEHCQQGFGFGDGEGGPPDMVVVLGGDGTMLSVARQTMERGPVLLGVNLGNLGFLTAATPADWQAKLAVCLEGACGVDERMVLSGQVLRNGQVVRQVLAVNDLVVSRGAMARLIRLRLNHGTEAVSTFKSDGVIFYSPTGATAYAVSAGGPVIHPSLSVIGITAICPFMSRLKSLVLPPEPPLRLHVDEEGGELFLTEDGQGLFQLHPGDLLTVSRHPKPLRLARINRKDPWYQALRRKGFSQC